MTELNPKAESKDTPEKSKRKVNHWARLAVVLISLMFLVGALRLYGAFGQRAVLVEFGVSKSAVLWLIVAGFFHKTLNTVAIVFILIRHRWRVYIALGAALLSFGIYWLERLFLWHPEQRAARVGFILSMQLVLLSVLGLFWLTDRKNAASSTQ